MPRRGSAPPLCSVAPAAHRGSAHPRLRRSRSNRQPSPQWSRHRGPHGARDRACDDDDGAPARATAIAMSTSECRVLPSRHSHPPRRWRLRRRPARAPPFALGSEFAPAPLQEGTTARYGTLRSRLGIASASVLDCRHPCQRCSRPLRRHPAFNNILAARPSLAGRGFAAHRQSMQATVRTSALAPPVFAATAVRRTRTADATVTSASPMSALQETCERSAIALKTVTFVMHSCVEETCAPYPAAQRNMCDRHRALR